GGDLRAGLDTVEIEVQQGAAGAVVFVDEGVGGAGDFLFPGHLPALRQSLHEGSFACAQVAAQHQHGEVGKWGGQAAAEGACVGGGGAAGGGGQRGESHYRDRASAQTPGSWRVMSPASRLISPWRAAAASPPRPCR